MVYAGLDALTASYTKGICFQAVFVALFFLLVFNTSAMVAIITRVREERFGLSVVVTFRAIIVYLTGDVSVLIEANNACVHGFAVFLACWLDIREAVGGDVVGGVAVLALSSLVALCVAILVHL